MSRGEGALAEFAALRQEIDSRASRQYGIFALHITASGAVFSFALSGSGRVAFLLILPISTYLFCARYVMEDNAIRIIGRYLQEELGNRVPGGLRWEQWRQAQPGHLPGFEWAHPSFVAFPGVALAALAWTVPVVFSGWSADALLFELGLLLVWLIGLAATAVSFVLILNGMRGWIARRAVTPTPTGKEAA
jgi:hypothetical protein